MPVSASERAPADLGAHASPAPRSRRVVRDVSASSRLSPDDHVHQGQRPAPVAAGEDREMLSASLPVRSRMRIDGVELLAVAPCFDDERPQMHVGAEDIRAPGDDQLRVAELLGLGAVANTERFVRRPPRRRRSRWSGPGARRPGGGRKRRSMPEPLRIPWCRRSCKARRFGSKFRRSLEACPRWCQRFVPGDRRNWPSPFARRF